jgi:hypothetical protein
MAFFPPTSSSDFDQLPGGKQRGIRVVLRGRYLATSSVSAGINQCKL